ncbi:TPA: hypothetical protein DCZ15_03755 [Candidatus Falkowbacteria bacterium]|nr:MAG: hypothetical protein UV95_C0004G0102 [Candidatus Falkowbacteria bacterium GW2011_GWF2_43_32]HBA36959.1 hypothetical protein [Candidatus Falkowbacteria bacterium]
MFFPLVKGAQAQTGIDPAFNPNRILEDWDILNYSSMTLPEIQTFLQNKGSYLANYTTTNTHGDLKTAAQIIHDAAYNNYDCEGITLSETPTETEKFTKCRHITTINPKFLLVLLQKEASLIEDANPSQNRLDWATGYGCPDNWVCNPYYKGFGKQVNSAALQFLAYMQEPQNYSYKAGQTYTFSNPYGTISQESMIVTPANQATAALYNYTPHVFNGNYNTYKLWNRYFPKVSRLYPNGSIIKASGDPRVWLIENGQKRHFSNWSSYISRFKPGQIVEVDSGELDNYPIGSEIKFANYSLVQVPDKTIYLLVDQEKRPFASATVFKKFGFNPEEVETATIDDLAGYKVGATINATSTYVTGALLQDSRTNDIYYVENGIKAPVDKVLLDIKFAGDQIIKKTTKELTAYATTTPLLLDEGTLVKTQNFPLVYLISGGKKRPMDDAMFSKLNYNPQNVVTVSSQFLYNYDMGEAVK